MSILSKIYNKIKQKIREYKVLSIISITVSVYFLGKVILRNKASSVKLSHFLLAIKQNAIEEVVATSSMILYF